MKSSTAILIASFSLAGCAGARQARPDPLDPSAATQPSVLQGLQHETEDQARRIAELEARLALLELEARESRERTPAKPSETVRIGEQRKAARDAAEPVPERNVRVVRLHQQPEPMIEEPLVLPEPPEGVPSKLAVVPLPHERASKALGAMPALASGTDSSGSAREQYRTALRTLRERRWDEARDAFGAFLHAHPDHELVVNATYWRGEAHYAQRRYADALIDFQSVVTRAAQSDKAADALFKLGMCQRHMGDQAAAERTFRKLREQYPSSDAARVASRENPS